MIEGWFWGLGVVPDNFRIKGVILVLKASSK